MSDDDFSPRSDLSSWYQMSIHGSCGSTSDLSEFNTNDVVISMEMSQNKLKSLEKDLEEIKESKPTRYECSIKRKSKIKRTDSWIAEHPICSQIDDEESDISLPEHIEAIKPLGEEKLEEAIDNAIIISSDMCLRTKFPDNLLKNNFQWPAKENFNAEHFYSYIEAYVDCWLLCPLYTYSIRFVKSTCVNYKSIFFYNVDITKPKSCEYGSIVTVIVKFTVSFEQKDPPNTVVNVTYQFDSLSQTHQADNRFKFQQTLIDLIFQNKLQIYQSNYYWKNQLKQ